MVFYFLTTLHLSKANYFTKQCRPKVGTHPVNSSVFFDGDKLHLHYK